MTFNIILIGDSNVGKYSLMSRFADDIFEENSHSTIGIEFKNKKINVDGQCIKLNILDTEGQEKYRSVLKNFIRNGDGIIFVFDLAIKESFQSIREWVMTSEELPQGIQKILVGNNFNLGDREIGKEKAENFGEKYNMKYFETNPRNGANVELIFMEMARLILSSKLKQPVKNKYTKKERLIDAPKKAKTNYNIDDFKLASDKLLKYMSQ